MSANAVDLWRWARGYAKRHEDTGKGTQYPTMREATKRFRCTLDDIENVIGDDLGEEDRYLGIATAVRAGGMGGGVAEIEARGDYLIEAY
jgi:hypothetical protein